MYLIFLYLFVEFYWNMWSDAYKALHFHPKRRPKKFWVKIFIFIIYFTSERNHQNGLRGVFFEQLLLYYQSCFLIIRRFFHILCLTKMLFYVFKGVEEFIDHGITPDKLLIGIPWHGYDYTCVNYTTDVSECYVSLRYTCTILWFLCTILCVKLSIKFIYSHWFLVTVLVSGYWSSLKLIQ